ncbi:MAG TPA: flagellar export chaperone FliS [Bryobacteraceae bacterium]|nr:flagellar export chaperone FliS [Bryobacteraceae bacterium]
MRSNIYRNFLEEEVRSASPVKLVQLLYEGALDAIGAARRYLRLGDIRARSRAITKAMAAVTELSLSLDHEAGGSLSKNLAELYGFIERQLIEGNARQTDAPLAAAERLLTILLEGWKTLPQEPAALPVPEQETAPESETYQPVSCAY